MMESMTFASRVGGNKFQIDMQARQKGAGVERRSIPLEEGGRNAPMLDIYIYWNFEYETRIINLIRDLNGDTYQGLIIIPIFML